MQMMDIVNRAIERSGVVSSFNPDDIPEDIQARAADVLRNELITDLNCDRNIDITETVIQFTPKDGRIRLKTTPDWYGNWIVGTVPFTASWLMKTEQRSFAPGAPEVYYMRNLMDCLKDLGYITGSYGNIAKTYRWPTDQLGNYIDLAMWTEDTKLVEVPADLTQLYNQQSPDFVNRLYNVPFYPAYVVGVYRAGDGTELTYLHHGEMVSSEFRHSAFVYTLEDDVTHMSIIFTRNGSGFPMLVVLPVPIRVVNAMDEPHPWTGEIVAPQKFRNFLITMLAARLSFEYGVSTQEGLEKEAAKAYANILKAKIKKEHPQDVPRRINMYLRRRGSLVPGGMSPYGGGGYVGV